MKAKRTDQTERIGLGLATAAFESIGFAFREQTVSDYGIDAHAELISNEEPTGQLLAIQLKSGQSYLSEPDGANFVFRIDSGHVSYWLQHALPVVVCLCDVDSKIVYWQAVTTETVISTGKMFKVLVPNSQQVDALSLPALCDILTPLIATNRYTIAKTDDSSHGSAKRYSFEIVVNGTMAKSEIAAVVRQVTNDGAKLRYHRNELVEGHWGNSDAHVVWTFVYLSAEDRARRNHICRSLWILDDLPESHRPIGIKGENIGFGIVVDWSSNYELLGTLADQHTMSKRDYITVVLPMLEELKECAHGFALSLKSLSDKRVTEAEFLDETQDMRQRLDDLYGTSADLGLAPFECHDMDGVLQTVIACLHNIVILYSESGLSKRDEKSRLFLAIAQLDDAQKKLPNLEYELSKIR